MGAQGTPIVTGFGCTADFAHRLDHVVVGSLFMFKRVFGICRFYRHQYFPASASKTGGGIRAFHGNPLVL